MRHLRLMALVVFFALVTVSFAQWQDAPLTDVRTGEMFRLTDFAGQTVLVETMATWCTSCLRQLNNVAEAKAQLEQTDNDDIVFVAISVETNSDPTSLRAYSEEHGFDWHFAVATPELLRALVDDFGRSVSVPPATPHFVIFPDGSVSDLTTGIEPAAALLEQLQ